MDTRYSASIVDQLLKSMSEYCQSIQTGARDVNRLINSSELWSDNQYEHFSACVRSLNEDLDRTLRMQSEYMTTLDAKAKELRL